jgi:hypothetical protein
MTERIARPGEINYAVVDRYTFAHYGLGAVMARARAPWWAVLGTAIGWEFAERGLKRALPEMFPYATQDTIPNAVGDGVALLLGWGTFRRR